VRLFQYFLRITKTKTMTATMTVTLIAMVDTYSTLRAATAPDTKEVCQQQRHQWRSQAARPTF
jgi:hypothetical protein